MTHAMVLCAGYGTRLRPLTLEVPKPLVPVGDRPLVVHIAAKLTSLGFEQIVINSHHLSEKFTNVCNQFQVKAHLIHEPIILGTAGGVANARSLLGPPPVLVWNGDILADPPVNAMLKAASRSGGLVLAVTSAPVGQGTVGVGDDGRIVRLRAGRFGDEASGGNYIGVAALGAHALADLPNSGCLIGDVALPALERGERVEVVRVEGTFSDVGDIGAYHALNLAWLAHTASDSFVGEGARIGAGVSLSRSIVGAGAEVVGAGPLERCVIWPRAKVTAPLKDVVVTTGGRIVPASGNGASS